MVVQVLWLGFELQCFQTGHFEYALKTAEQPEQQTAFERCFGKDLFSFLRENDTERKLFTSGMKAQDSLGKSTHPLSSTLFQSNSVLIRAAHAGDSASACTLPENPCNVSRQI